MTNEHDLQLPQTSLRALTWEQLDELVDTDPLALRDAAWGEITWLRAQLEHDRDHVARLLSEVARLGSEVARLRAGEDASPMSGGDREDCDRCDGTGVDPVTREDDNESALCEDCDGLGRVRVVS